MPREEAGDVDVPRLFRDSTSRYETFKERVSSSLGNVTALAEAMAESETYSGDKTKDLSKLQLCAEQLARLEEECVARGSVCSSIRQSLVREANNGESAINEVEEYRRQVEVAEQRWKPENVNAVEKNRLVKKVRELVRTVRDGADDDIVMQTTSDSAPQHCPCTMGPLENPVVNKQCGHVYSTAGIIGLLCQGRAGHVPSKIEDVNPTFQKPCPRVGCSKIVNASMLERDFRTEASQRQARRRAATQHDPDDDDNVEEL